MSGRFVPWQDVMKQSGKGSLRGELPTAKFHAAVRQAAVAVDDESKRVDFSFDGGTVALRARGASTGSSDVTLDVPRFTVAIDVAFDPQYVIEFLKAAEADGAESVSIQAADGAKPVLFGAGDGWSMMCMPLAG